MIQLKKHTRILFVIPMIIIGVVIFNTLWPGRTHDQRLDDAVTQIVNSLSADPNYEVTGLLQMIVEQSESKPGGISVRDGSDHQLQVTVSKEPVMDLVGWRKRMYLMARQLPKIIRPNPYSILVVDTRIRITCIAPSTDEIKRLRGKVASLATAPDVAIIYDPYGPDNDELKELGFTFRVDHKPKDSLWNFDQFNPILDN